MMLRTRCLRAALAGLLALLSVPASAEDDAMTFRIAAPLGCKASCVDQIVADGPLSRRQGTAPLSRCQLMRCPRRRLRHGVIRDACAEAARACRARLRR